MKKLLMLALLLGLAFAVQTFIACDDDDDDDDTSSTDDDVSDDDAATDDDATSAPLIPHGEQGECLDCHTPEHGTTGDYSDCLSCHQYEGTAA